MLESKDLEARIESAQDDFKLLRTKPRHAKVVEAFSSDSPARKRESMG
jgi:hypothetical protein